MSVERQGPVRLFLYGTLVVVLDALARPLFWLIHYKPKGDR